MVYTFREGVAASVGHDLVLEATSWSADITVGDDDTVKVDAAADLATLVVRKGLRGVKPLSDRDKREIAHTARGLLDTDHQPTATFGSTSVTRDGNAGTIAGELTIRGVTRPCTLTVRETGPDHVTAGGELLSQSEFGIKRYTAFFGALRLADRVRVEIELDLSALSSAGT